jgi:hypothetical protein
MPNCPVCSTQDAKEYNSGKADVLRVDCKRCGEFDLSGTVMAMLPSALNGGVHRRALMSHALRRMGASRVSPPPIITSDMLNSFWPLDKLPTPGKQADDLILFAGDRQLSPETSSDCAAYFLDAWLGTSLLVPHAPHGGLHWTLQHLKSDGLLGYSSSSSGLDDVLSIRLTMAGWQKYEQLTQVRSESRTAFMAMKFGDDQLDGIVEEVFKPAVKRAGFELKKLTDEQPAGLIDDQIRASILSGRFVIADLTHGSYGAYWEAGFAEGLNLPVIYTCSKTAWDEKSTHFDTNHMLTIIWDPNNLKKAGNELTAAIRATLRTEAQQQD